MGNCREENKVRSCGGRGKEPTLNGIVWEGGSEGVIFELKSEGREPSDPQLGVRELFLAQEAANAKALRQNMAGVF